MLQLQRLYSMGALVFPVRVEESPHVIEGEFQEAVVDVQAPAEDVQHGNEHVQDNAEEVNEASEDFEEAAAILNKFPRGAAALTRICIQKMMPLVKGNAKNLDENFSSLVRKGLEVEIQQAMDVLQVIRRNPGQESDVDLRDETAIATRMLESLKEILERRMLRNREEK
jgi:hypothetical protein